MPLWKKLIFACVTILAILGLCEGVLAIVGIEPAMSTEDPFVGFASNVPLFVPTKDADGRPLLETGPNKLALFNVQVFPQQKPVGTTRIFCLGGSTTYGRPYNDETSFSSWLRTLLPLADPERGWEVINAGAISYASYRVAHVLEELTRYEPDLFIIYTGHNEFLEERTYGQFRRVPGPVRSIMAVLAHTRTWSALQSLVARTQPIEESGADGRTILPDEVKAKLDRSAGPSRYERDDALANQVLEHYRYSLERMVDLARSAGADIIFVTPASNLKDCTPFKSQRTAGLAPSERDTAERMVTAADSLMDERRWAEALETIDAALDLDPQWAGLHFSRGTALLALERMQEAEAALIRARDEDVCPLRALSSMQETVARVAREAGAGLVDYAGNLRKRSLERTGQAAPGEEFFLDHVHPTIEGHRILAVALIEEMARMGRVRLGEGWTEDEIADAADRFEAGIDSALHARALANLALVLDWAGKDEESRRLAFRALESGVEDPTILMMAARHLTLDGKGEEALPYFLRALRTNPNNPVLHSQFGLFLAGRGEFDRATAHFFMASLLSPGNPNYHQQLGSILAQRGRPADALASYEEAGRLDPGSRRVEEQIEALRLRITEDSKPLPPPEISVTRYPSGYPETVGQTRPGASGRPVRDGIWTEWHDGGALRTVADYRQGRIDGVTVTWTRDGAIISRVEVNDRSSAPEVTR